MDNTPPFISNFIEMYRKRPCLWKIKDEAYSNKIRREEAYNELLELYREAIPSATLDTVKRKINNLRCSFRKIQKKVKKADATTGEGSYKPTLWYYNLLLFLYGQDDGRAAAASDDDDDDDDSDIADYNNADESLQEEIEVQIKRPSQPRTVNVKTPKRNLSGQYLDVLNDDSATSARADSPPSPDFENRPKRFKTEGDMIAEAYDAMKKPMDEYDAVGLNVACKLRRMNENQRNLAELLISKVLIYGIRKRLTDEHDVVV